MTLTPLLLLGLALLATLAVTLHRALRRAQGALMSVALRSQEPTVLELLDEPAPHWRSVVERPQGSQRPTLRVVR